LKIPYLNFKSETVLKISLAKLQHTLERRVLQIEVDLPVSSENKIFGKLLRKFITISLVSGSINVLCKFSDAYIYCDTTYNNCINNINKRSNDLGGISQRMESHTLHVDTFS
jgi:hypothetical protein